MAFDNVIDQHPNAANQKRVYGDRQNINATADRNRTSQESPDARPDQEAVAKRIASPGDLPDVRERNLENLSSHPQTKGRAGHVRKRAASSRPVCNGHSERITARDAYSQVRQGVHGLLCGRRNAAGDDKHRQ